MVFNTESRTASSGLALEFSAAVHHLMQRLHDYKTYRKTVRELSKLDDRTLAELCIHRSGITAEARKAVYDV
ncbi:DUF1127 domain-containing protein [Roseovarius amoyensis]|uniref:DUF1127 domain-containing protein n=1 Tax=Roseovarius amoyensis TaxID=2211448 RepID=UPI000DBE70A7|nr:DUF1127 domain-containing protein [Roseovarius amoyensis]